MTLADELHWLDGIATAELIRRQELTPLEVVDAAISRAERLNPAINAIVTPLFEEARRRAGSAPLTDAPLAGVPFLLKDLGATLGGIRQTSGSVALRDYVAPRDSELVRRHKAAGLAILGKTNTPEFGNHSTTEPVLFGPARNPWALDRTTGGSSGGSAAAVAAGIVPAAHGNDGAGSLRIPASCCGTFGFKPTRGRNSWAPGADAMAGLAVEHAVTRSVRDSAAILDATSGAVAGDPYALPRPQRSFVEEAATDPGRLRIAWSPRAPIGDPVDPECASAARDTAEMLANLGHDVAEDAPAFDADVLAEPLARAWAISNLDDWHTVVSKIGREPSREELEITTWELIEYARSFDAASLMDALGSMAIQSRRIAEFFTRYDAWVTPCLAQPPLPLGVLNASSGGAVQWWRFDLSFNAWNPIANITGNPAMSLPLHASAAGLPIGTLVTGRYGDEPTLFQLAGQLERARPWSGRRPSLSAPASATG